MPGLTNTHTVPVPPLPPATDVTFSVLWIGGESPDNLTVQLLRPNGVAVLPSDADVLSSMILDGSAASFYMAGNSFTIAGATAGNWSVRVTGTSTHPDGAPYLVSVTPESEVALSAATSGDLVLAGGAQIISAQLLDAGVPIAATIAARLLKVDGTEETIVLVDDGTNGDAAAGDLLYSRTVPTAGACGTTRLLVAADAATSSEGAVHREQLASFDVNVAGDATRDPCDADDDGDGLTDEAELDTHGTNPVNSDTDGDGLTDDFELGSVTSPTDADTDDDEASDGAEFAAGTDPLDPDTDNDALLDGAELRNGTAALAFNPDPANPNDDGDACSDAEELGPSPVSGGLRDPLTKWDFFDVNGDRSIDLADALAILGHFGHGPETDPFDNVADRAAPNVTQPWRTAEDNDGVDLQDALRALNSFGHLCVG